MCDPDNVYQLRKEQENDWHWQSEPCRLSVEDQHRVMLAGDPLDLLTEQLLDLAVTPLPAALKRPILMLVKSAR